jgi:hypothetical protein
LLPKLPQAKRKINPVNKQRDRVFASISLSSVIVRG